MSNHYSNRAEQNCKHKKIYYLLITSLFYPAILGSIFYTLLEGCYEIKSDLKSLLIIISLSGILISFCMDFLYTWVSKNHYTGKLFIADLSILLLIVLAYRNLIEGIVKNVYIGKFFLCFLLIHLIFLIWDFFLIPSSGSSLKIKLYDVLGLILSLVGLLRFFDSPIFGVGFLWIFTVGSIITVGLDSIKKINSSEY